MSQTAITPKSGLTITGTDGTVFVVAGQDTNGIIGWRQSLGTDSPMNSAALTQQSKSNEVGKWSSTTRLSLALMKETTDSGVSGYVAAPAVADRTVFELRVTRSPLMTDADALKALEQFLQMLAADTKLRTGALGYVPANA